MSHTPYHDARYQIAQLRPRDWKVVAEQLFAACKDPLFARSAYVAVAGEESLTVDFADLAQQCLGHLMIDTLPANEAPFCWRLVISDLASNVTLSDVYAFTAEMPWTEMRSIEGRVRRDLVLKLVPGYLRGECLQLCRDTMRAHDAKHLPEVSKTVVARLVALGVDNATLKGLLGHAPSTLTVPEVEQLRSLALLLRQGDSDLPTVQARWAPPKAPAKPEAAKKKPEGKPARAKRQPAAAARTEAAPPTEPAPRASLRDAEDDEEPAPALDGAQLS